MNDLWVIPPVSIYSNLSDNGMTNFDTSNVNGMSRLIEMYGITILNNHCMINVMVLHNSNLDNNKLRNVILSPTVFTRLNFPHLVM